jgi:cell wall assembly regulator SMI1
MTGRAAQRVSDQARDPSGMREGTLACPGHLRQAVREGPCAWRMTTERVTSPGVGQRDGALALKVPPSSTASPPWLPLRETVERREPRGGRPLSHTQHPYQP